MIISHLQHTFELHFDIQWNEAQRDELKTRKKRPKFNSKLWLALAMRQTKETIKVKCEEKNYQIQLKFIVNARIMSRNNDKLKILQWKITKNNEKRKSDCCQRQRYEMILLFVWLVWRRENSVAANRKRVRWNDVRGDKERKMKTAHQQQHQFDAPFYWTQRTSHFLFSFPFLRKKVHKKTMNFGW